MTREKRAINFISVMLEYTPVFGVNADETLVSDSEGKKLAALAGSIARWALYIAFLLFPLAYVPGLVDSFELPKQTFLVIVTAVAVLAWLGKMLATRKLELRRSVMNLFVVVYFGIYAAAAWFSQNRYLSFAGDAGQEKAALSTLACFILLYFVTSNVLREAKDVRAGLGWLMLGGVIALAASLAQVFGLHILPGSINQASYYNTVGTTNALAAYGVALASIAMGLFLLPAKDERLSSTRKAVMGALIAVAAVYVAAQNFWALWVMVVAASLLIMAFGMTKTERNIKVTMLVIPMVAVVVGILMILVRLPFDLGFPSEVMPSMSASWNISKDTLTRSSLLGSGPGTFSYDYAQFRSPDLNTTNFWSTTFDRSSSRLLTVLATTGILGLASLLFMVLFLSVRTKIKLWRGHEEWITTLSVFAGWSALLVGKIVYSSNITLEFAFWMLTAMLVSLEWHDWSKAKLNDSPRSALIISFLFIVVLIFSVAGLYLQLQRLVAESHYSQGVKTQISKMEDVEKAVMNLARASQLNSKSDLYMRSLAQALSVQANLEASKAGDRPSVEASQKITNLAVAAIDKAKLAAQLNPADSVNWSVLADMYRDLGPTVPGATEAAQQAYAKSQELNPNNPVYATELGKIHLVLATAAMNGINRDSSEQEQTVANAKESENLTKAKTLFERAVALKQDYAPAHYWLAIVMEREGKVNEAIAKLESVRNYNPSDLGVGFQLAILYYQDKQISKAIVELERLIGINPEYSNARWYLSVMYEENKELEKAIAQIVEIQKSNPNNRDVAKRLEDLQAKLSGTTVSSTGGLPEPVGSALTP